MPSNFCLLPQYAEELQRKLESGELGLDRLAAMTSADRHAAFSEIMGDANAQSVNAAFESKLLLQNQQKGLETWIRQATKGKPEVARDLLSRVARMDRVLEPGDADGFLADLAKQRLGFSVTQEEAGRIAELAKAAAAEKSAALAAAEKGEQHLPYGQAKVAFSNYISDLKNSVKEPLTVSRALTQGAGLSKSILASLDDSALFRQGWKNLFAHPDVWAKNARQSFTDLARELGGHEVLNDVQADIQSRPNALNGRYRQAQLALGNIEDQFPVPLPQKFLERVPLVGRAFKASEAAFTAFQLRSRADLFDKYMQIAEKSGVDLNDKAQLQSIGNLVNELTSRGHLGKAEGAANVTNQVFFSLRKLKADFDFLTAHQLQGDVTPFVRKQAAVNLVKVVTGTGAVLALAHAVGHAFGHDDAVEFDPRSSDFGKVKVGDTRFDVTGGMGSLLTLGARLATMSSKSTTSHIVSPLNSGKFGAATGQDLVVNFFDNKLSPAAGIVRDLLKGERPSGDKPTLLNEAAGLVNPLPISNAWELYQDPKSANLLLGVLADAFGIATNTYDGKPKKKKP